MLTQKSLVFRVSSFSSALESVKALDTNDSGSNVINAQGESMSDVIFKDDRPATVGLVYISQNQDLIVATGPIVSAVYNEDVETFYTFTVLYDPATLQTSWDDAYQANENWIGHTDTDYTIKIFGT
jgi:hypothetical protein